MKGRRLATMAALALGAGSLFGRSVDVLAVSDPLVGATLALAYPEPARPPAASGRPVDVRIDGRRPRAKLDERFLSVALDTSEVLGGRWWGANASHIEIGRGDARTTPFDFARPRLLQLASALAPAYLRVGGTEADFVYYAPGAPQAPPPGYELVLTRERWDAVNTFARASGFDLLFTVNAGAGPRGPDGRWTSANADSLLEYTREAGYQVPVWELGNEVDAYWFTQGISRRVSGRQYADDLARFRSRVRAVFPRAKVAGPAAFYWPVTGEGSLFSDFMREFLEAGGSDVDIVTWHFYPQQSRRCPLATRRASTTGLLDPTALDEAGKWADAIEAMTAARAPNARLWLDETGNAQCGGEPGVSDRFVSSLWWVDELGLAASHGQNVVVRQTLAGSNYGLIDDETLAPNPDYWASLLWKRSMGRVVLGVSASGDDASVRAYAHCAPEGKGGVSLLLVNLHRDSGARVRVAGDGVTAARLFLVSSPSLSSPEVYLNGKPLRFDGALPVIEPSEQGVPGGIVNLPAASYAFVVLPDAGAEACAASL